LSQTNESATVMEIFHFFGTKQGLSKIKKKMNLGHGTFVSFRGPSHAWPPGYHCQLVLTSGHPVTRSSSVAALHRRGHGVLWQAMFCLALPVLEFMHSLDIYGSTSTVPRKASMDPPAPSLVKVVNKNKKLLNFV